MEHVRAKPFRNKLILLDEFASLLRDPLANYDIEFLYKLMMGERFDVQPYNEQKITNIFCGYLGAAIRIDWPDVFMRRGYMTKGECANLRATLEARKSDSGGGYPEFILGMSPDGHVLVGKDFPCNGLGVPFITSITELMKQFRMDVQAS